MDQFRPQVFQKRNATRVVIRNRNSVTRATPKPTTPTPTTTLLSTVLPKFTRKVQRRKIARTTIIARIHQTTTPASARFTDSIEEISSVLPALTSVKPRKTSKPPPETTTRAVKKNQPIQVDDIETKLVQSSFDKILKQQYKIKGLDIDSEENYEEDEKLIGVLGSQVDFYL